MDNLSLFTLFLACATFLLALAAFWSIVQNKKFQKLEVRERLLKEILDWATQSINCEFLPDTSFIKSLGNFKEASFLFFADLDKLQFMFRRLHTLGSYMSRVVSTFNKEELK